MDRGIPTEEVLAQMRASEPPIQYVVGTPKGRLTELEGQLAAQPWQQARESVQVKLLSAAGELYILVNSQARVDKERAIRRRKLKGLWKRLQQLQRQRPSYDKLVGKIAVARHQAGRTAALVKITLPEPPTSKKARARRADFTFALNRAALRKVCQREGRYLVRTNLTETDPAKVWEFYLILVAVEAAFRNLKGDLAVRPIYHQKEPRIEAHIFVAFLAYCLHVTLQAKLRPKAPGLTPRAVLEKFAPMQMLDVHFPTTDGRELIFSRYTQPEVDQKILLHQLGWSLPPQPPPRITAKLDVEM
jgi:hypothetical protein